MFYDPIAPEYILNQPQSQADESQMNGAKNELLHPSLFWFYLLFQRLPEQF